MEPNGFPTALTPATATFPSSAPSSSELPPQNDVPEGTNSATTVAQSTLPAATATPGLQPHVISVSSPSTSIALPGPAKVFFPDNILDVTLVRSLRKNTRNDAAFVKFAHNEMTHLYTRKSGDGVSTLPSEQLAAEYFALKLYRLAGAAAPAVKMYMGVNRVKSYMHINQVAPFNGTSTTLLTQLIEGRTLAEIRSSSPQQFVAAKTALQKHFVLDCLLANWNVIGNRMRSIVVTNEGIPFRTGVSGAFDFSATGERKSDKWGANVQELISLLNPLRNKATTEVFRDIPHDDILSQIATLLAIRGKILENTPAIYRDVMSKRLDYLQKYLDASKPSATSLS